VLKRTVMILAILAAAVLGWTALAIAADPPHTTSCAACHTIHQGSGEDLTAFGAISEVCISCHNTGGVASTKPFSSSMQAVPGTSGTSHRWDYTMDCVLTPSKCGPDSQYGLRKPAADPSNPQPDEIQNYTMNMELIDTGYVVTCSICHDAHTQFYNNWNPFRHDFGTATGGGTTTIQDTSKSWTANQWKGYSVEITGSLGSNLGKRRTVKSNTTNTITITSTFPESIVSGDVYSLYGGEFQADDNQLNQLCEDCHYYRTASDHTSISNVNTYDGLIKSHPVANLFSGVSDASQYNTSPLEPASASWAPQTGSRYELNGGIDTNFTNNMVVDEGGRLRCLTCHNIHYADSDASTVDGP
jgi:predicted CXXCH cytochrome family protein